MSRPTEELTESIHASIPILGQMGIRVLEAGPGHAVVELPAEPNINHFGALYAGSLYTAAEVLGGIIPRVSFDLEGELAGFVPLLKSSEIRYFKPALGRVRARAALADGDLERLPGDALANGKVDFVLDAEIVDDEDNVLATSRGVYQLRRLS